MKRIATMIASLGAAALAIGLTVTVPSTPATAAMPVFDAANYSQNLVQAARALEQINHQVQSLQNQAAMLQDMARNLERIDFPELQKMNSTLSDLGQLMEKAEAIHFRADEVDSQFRSMFPDAYKALKTDKRAADARARLDSAMDAFRHSLGVQARVVAGVEQDSGLLAELVGRSQGAVGSLQAQQASNQLLALGAKQQLQLEDMLAAQFRSEAIDRARRAQSEAEARAATARFLGSGKAVAGEPR